MDEQKYSHNLQAIIIIQILIALISVATTNFQSNSILLVTMVT